MNDHDLQEAFAALRDADRQKTPSFDEIHARALACSRPLGARQRGKFARLANCVPVSAAAIVVSVALWTGFTRDAPQQEQVVLPATSHQVEELMATIDSHLAAREMLQDWQSPTDFLLTNIFTPTTPEDITP